MRYGTEMMTPGGCRPARRLVAIALAVLAAWGCGDGREARYPVTGRVLLDGEPVTVGIVVFYPEDGRRQSMGDIGSDGRYRLTTYDLDDGALAGTHRVVVEAKRPVNDGPASLAEEAALVEAVAPRIERLVPAAYGERSTTPVTVEVGRSANVIDISLSMRSRD